MAALHSAHFIKEGRIKRKVWDLQEEWMRAEAGAAEKNKIEEGRFCGDLSIIHPAECGQTCSQSGELSAEEPASRYPGANRELNYQWK